MAFGPFLAAAGWLALMWGPGWWRATCAMYGPPIELIGRCRGRPLRVGLTGGIASGKSTVANLFAALGVPDHRHRRHRARGSRSRQPRCSARSPRFGPGMLGSDGASTGARCGRVVFADPAERARLEACTHPAIRALTDAQSDAAGGRRTRWSPSHCWSKPAAAIASTGCWSSIATTRCRSRACRRATAPRASEAERMLAAQATRAARLAAANDVIHNDGDIGHLRDQVEELHRGYVAAAAAHGRSRDL